MKLNLLSLSRALLSSDKSNEAGTSGRTRAVKKAKVGRSGNLTARAVQTTAASGSAPSAPSAAARTGLPDRRGETPARIAYPFSARPEGYADLEMTDFSTQAAAALKPVAMQVSEESHCTGHKPPADVVSVDVFGAYLDALPVFRQKLESAGFLKSAPLSVKHGILSYTERRHIKENIQYKRQDREKLVPLSETGRTEGAKAPRLTQPTGAMRAEERQLVQGRNLYGYAFERLRGQSMALSKVLVPASRNPAGLIDGWKMAFASEKEVKAFFKREFDVTPKSLSKQDEIAWMVDEGVRLAGERAAEARGQKFKTRTEVRKFFESRFQLAIDNPNAEQRAALLAGLALKATPLGEQVFESASRFNQTVWDVGQNPKLRGRPTSFVLADGTTCKDASREGRAGFEVSLGDGSATLKFTRQPTASAFEVKLDLGEGREVTQIDPQFMAMVRSRFSQQVLGALFGEAKPSDFSEVGTFQEIFGQVRARTELESKLDDWLYKDLKDAVRERLKEAGDPVVFQGTGNSYNKALYGENWGSEARSKVMEQIFKQAGEGDIFAHGSCGFQQEAIWMFGGHMVAYQDDGKTYRYSDHGGDPLEVECKQTYQSVKPYTDTAGVYESKVAVEGGDPASQGAERWVQRDVAPLTLNFSSPRGDEIRTHMLRDDAGKPIIASAGLRVDSYQSSLGRGSDISHSVTGDRNFVPPYSAIVTLKETTPPGQVLADDLGRPVLDELDGQPIRVIEEVVLEAVIDGQPLTLDAASAKRAAIEARLRVAGAVVPNSEHPDTKTTYSEDVIRKLADKQLATEVTYRVAELKRWERVPLTQMAADGRHEPMMGPHGILHTYRRVTHAHPPAEMLTDRVHAQIHCVHSQNGLNVPYVEQLLAPGTEIVGHSIPREGVQADTPLASTFRPAATRAFNKPFGAYQPPGTLREKAVIESMEGHNWRTTQPHSDMFKGEAVGRRADGTLTQGEDPMVPFEIQHEVEDHLHGSRAGIEGAITSGIALRDYKNVKADLQSKLTEVRQGLDDATLASQSRQELYGSILSPAVPRPSTGEAPRPPVPALAGIARLRKYVPAPDLPAPSPVTANITPDAAPAPTREALLALVDQQLSQLRDGLEMALDSNERVARGFDMEHVIQRHFRPWPDKISTTAEFKAASGAGDIFGSGALGAELGHSVAATTALSAGTLLGSLMLAVAGVEGMKDAATDVRRLRQLIKPLKAHQQNLLALQRELRAQPGDEPSPALAESVDPSLKGVAARLRAANRQLNDSVTGILTSGLLTTAGGVGVAGGAVTMAGAAAASKVLGGVYGGLVMSFGAITAAQGAHRWRQLQGVPEAVERTLGKDNALRVGLVTLLEHERDARKSEIASRAVLAATGATSLTLNVLGAAGAIPTAGASIGLIAAGVGMGAATAAAFRPVKSRQRGLHAIGAVERTTNLPTTFLQSHAQLNHLVNKLNNQGNIVTHFQRKIIDAHMPYSFRAHRAVSKVLPQHDRRQIAQAMLGNPQAVADESMQFMLRASQFERHYLQENKLPALQQEVDALLKEFIDTPADGAAGAVAAPRRQMLAMHLKAKADTLLSESARHSQLQGLEERLNHFTRHLGKEFLSDPALAHDWKELQVDFIVSHDLAAEAMSRKKLKLVQARSAAAAEADGDSAAPLRQALSENIDRRFAKVFTHAYPDKIAYERRGALELARIMFMEEAGREISAPQAEGAQESQAVELDDDADRDAFTQDRAAINAAREGWDGFTED